MIPKYVNNLKWATWRPGRRETDDVSGKFDGKNEEGKGKEEGNLRKEREEGKGNVEERERGKGKNEKEGKGRTRKKEMKQIVNDKYYKVSISLALVALIVCILFYRFKKYRYHVSFVYV